MKKREYYSIRTGKMVSGQEINLPVLKRLFMAVYNKMTEEGYFQKYFGYYCVDGECIGELGRDIDSIIFINIRKENLYPVYQKIDNYSEDDLFDVIEFLHDHCSKGIEGDYHSWNDCGYHYHTFDDEAGQKHFRELLNLILKDYMEPYELSVNGEILSLGDQGLHSILTAGIPTKEEQNVSSRIEKSILKFRRYKSSISERHEAVRELVDVLEYLRPKAKIYLDKKDENELFNIANNFGIRHHNEIQKTGYDKAIWLSWMFYHYLATIHALLRLIEKNEASV
ncbi:hypothetical protein GCM10007415_34610 [Parapedobacter pyrenivorans]|uniref:Uncharacterized protein n=1 Tax=Parapedobacter pyrenivorans TaxID=1305674 RepID=A0A917MDE1_9SPHI|nr:hypothetical protein [Parapedobacter pyrenivorans]GGG96495.1 hypothetical protein GCM10007415_34610 [Parapedobacter pyrenivorans]